jgi:hypothetical protein
MKLNFKLDWKKLRPAPKRLADSGPDADWRRIFFVFGLLTFLILAAGLYMFFAVQNNIIFTIEPDQNSIAPHLNSSTLQKTVDYYQNRTTDFNNIKISKEVVKDPAR